VGRELPIGAGGVNDDSEDFLYNRHKACPTGFRGVSPPLSGMTSEDLG